MEQTQEQALQLLDDIVETTEITWNRLQIFYENYQDRQRLGYIIPREIYEVYPTEEEWELLWNTIDTALGYPPIPDTQPEREISGAGLLVRDEGRLPPSVRNILKSHGDEKIKTVQVWKYPLFNNVTQTLINSLVKQPYDKFFHLGINFNDAYNLDKNVVLKMAKGKEMSDANENKPGEKTETIKVNKDITINELFEKLKKKMGNDLENYSARTNNCQDLVMNVLSILGLSNPTLKKFVKQDTEAVFKKLGFFEGIVEAGAEVLTTVKKVKSRVQEGEGSCSCQEGMGGGLNPPTTKGRGEYVYNYALPRCKIQY